MDAKIPQWLKERLIFAPVKGDKHNAAELKEIEYPPRACEDCDKTVECSRTVTCKREFSHGGWWAIYCTACGCYKHPETGRFELGKKGLRPTFKEYLKKKDK